MESLWEYTSELIGGIEYKMSPINYFHYSISKRIANTIEPFLNKNYELVQDVCVLPEEGTKVFPDIAVFEAPLNLTKNGSIRGVPVFVAEVISPSTNRKDRIEKKNLYERIGVKDYWVVDPRSESIDVYKLDGEYKLEDIYQNISGEEYDQATRSRFPHLITTSFGITVDIWDIFKS